MADQVVKLLRKQHPDPSYVKKVFQYVREDLGLKGGTVRSKRLPELMTEDELNRFYKAVWHASNRFHMVMKTILQEIEKLTFIKAFNLISISYIP